MARGDALGELEQVVLLALLRLGDEAYGVTLRAEIAERTGRSLSPGTIYPTLERLQRKGYVRSWLGDPSPERGGRAKRHFALEPAGLEVLRDAWGQLHALAEGSEALLERNEP